MTIQITKPELRRSSTSVLRAGRFKDAEDVILQALQASGSQPPGLEQQRHEAIQRLRTFGETHGLSLGGMTIRELREQARP